jgi:hypothetical protein
LKKITPGTTARAAGRAEQRADERIGAARLADDPLAPGIEAGAQDRQLRGDDAAAQVGRAGEHQAGGLAGGMRINHMELLHRESVPLQAAGCLVQLGGDLCRFLYTGVDGHRRDAMRQPPSTAPTWPTRCSEALFDRLADVVFFVKDAHGRYVVVNSTLMWRCGFAHKGSLIGHSPLKVFPPEQGSCMLSGRSPSRT